MGAPNVVGMLWRALYTVAGTITGMVGLTPVDLVYVVVGVVAIALVVQVVGAVRQSSTFTLSDE